MTGFGAGSAPLGSGSLRVEIRALNHRHQDVRLRLQTELSEHGFFLEQLARKLLGRGRFDVSVRSAGTEQAEPRIQSERAASFYTSLCELRDRLAPGSELPISAVLNLPGVLVSAGPDTEATRRALEGAFLAAVSDLDRMRDEEGRALALDLRGRLAQARSLVQRLDDSRDGFLRAFRERLRDRVTKLLAESQLGTLSNERLEQEMVLLAERSDITEELVRLASHFAQMDQLLGEAEPVGRRLDFLFQEMGREVNTIGSKSQHAPVAHLIVDLKAELERMREQVQNVD